MKSEKLSLEQFAKIFLGVKLSKHQKKMIKIIKRKKINGKLR